MSTFNIGDAVYVEPYGLLTKQYSAVVTHIYNDENNAGLVEVRYDDYEDRGTFPISRLIKP